ncbi:hypothetical protein [Microcoleus sp. CAWBG58]|uniref:hypothetical protein n=1 Tax=Microcoleus sp. CAWBG58 TaxID=2841651 RepID=UPI0025EBFB18|nr:hypothetical protein [Microcoleus sp. CAWBG58]
MSRTSNLYAEVWRNNQWEPTPTPKWSKGEQIPVCYMSPTGLYELYAALVGYYHRAIYDIAHTEEIVPLSKPRGFPKDMNAVYKEYFENFWYLSRQNCYLTWFTVQEVIDYDWDRKFPPHTGYVKNQYAHLFWSSASFPEAFPDDEPVYYRKKEGYTEVSWVQSYREFVGCVDWFIEELLKLGNPKEVRIIFWLE